VPLILSFRRRRHRRASRRRTFTTPCGPPLHRLRSSAPRSRCTCVRRCARASWPSARAVSRASGTARCAWPSRIAWASGSRSPAMAWLCPFARRSAGTRATASRTRAGRRAKRPRSSLCPFVPTRASLFATGRRLPGVPERGLRTGLVPRLSLKAKTAMLEPYIHKLYTMHAPLRALPCAGSARPCCTRTSRTSTTPSARSRRPRRRARPRRRRRPRARLCPRRPRRRRRRRRPRPTSSSATATSSRTTTPTARSSPTPRARASSPTTPRSTARPTCCASRLRRARASTSTTAASGCACAHP